MNNSRPLVVRLLKVSQSPEPSRYVRPSVLPSILIFLGCSTLVGVQIWWNIRSESRLSSLENKGVQLEALIQRFEKVRSLTDLAETTQQLREIRTKIDRVYDLLDKRTN